MKFSTLLLTLLVLSVAADVEGGAANVKGVAADVEGVVADVAGAVVDQGLLSPAAVLASRDISPPYYESNYDPDLAPEEAPIIVKDFPPEPLPGRDSDQSNFLEACAVRLTGDCGEAIFTDIFWNQTSPISDHCCRNLVGLGLRCHVGLVANIINNHPAAFKTNEIMLLLRSLDIWNMCALVAKVEPAIPSPSPHEENNEIVFYV
ncbi:hypothetical protein TB2_013112 [Malus domestica]